MTTREYEPDEGSQRTVAELLAQYGSGGVPQGGRRRRRASDSDDTAPHAIIDRVLSDSGTLRAITDQPAGNSHALPEQPRMRGPHEAGGSTGTRDGSNLREPNSRGRELGSREHGSSELGSRELGSTGARGSSTTGPHALRDQGGSLRRELGTPGSRDRGSGLREPSGRRETTGSHNVSSLREPNTTREPPGTREPTRRRETTGSHDISSLRETRSTREAPGLREDTGFHNIANLHESSGTHEVSGTRERSTREPGGRRETGPTREPPSSLREPGATRGREPGRSSPREAPAAGAAGGRARQPLPPPPPTRRQRADEGPTDRLPRISPDALNPPSEPARLPPDEPRVPRAGRKAAVMEPPDSSGPDHPSERLLAPARGPADADTAVTDIMHDDELLDDDLIEDGEPSVAREWLVVITQLLAGAVAGAALWLAFRWLWRMSPAIAAVAGVLTTVVAVLLVRRIWRSDDLRTTVMTILIGLFVTLSPAVLLLDL